MKKLLSLLVVSLCTLSCSSPISGSNKKEKNVVRLNITQDPTTLDPRKGGDFTTSSLHFLLYEGLRIHYILFQSAQYSSGTQYREKARYQFYKD